MARRIAAILAADIAGHREPAAAKNDLATARSLHPPGILPMIAGFEGRLVERPRGGFLIEFLDVVDAAKCAASIQDIIQERNARVPAGLRTHLQIGLDQGEVLAEGSQLSGSGIEVASKLGGVCDPGGICLSAAVYDQVKSRFQVPYQDIGELTIENISAPVRAYKVSLFGSPIADQPRANRRPPLRPQSVAAPRSRRKIAFVASAAAMLLMSAGIAAMWLTFGASQSVTGQAGGTSPPVKAPAVALTQPQEPAVARTETEAGREFQVAAVPTAGTAGVVAAPNPVSATIAMPPPEGQARVEVHVAAPKPPATAPAAEATLSNVAGLGVAPTAPPAVKPAAPASASVAVTTPAKSEDIAAPGPAKTAALTSPRTPTAMTPAPLPPAAAAISPTDTVAPVPEASESATPPPSPASPPVASLPPRPAEPVKERAPTELIAELTKKGIQAAQSNDLPFAKTWFDEILLIQPDNPQALNNRCWINALLNDLSAAIKDCDAALQLRPTFVDALDSRAFVKLKSGKAREAIVDYDAALKIQGNKASSLFGRGIAKKRSGNAAGGDADISRAKSISPRIVEEFAGYGIR